MPKPSGLEQYASKWALSLAGSILVLSVAFNNVGIGKVLDAYAQSLVKEIDNKQCKIEIEDRLLRLEEKSHSPKDNNNG